VIEVKEFIANYKTFEMNLIGGCCIRPLELGFKPPISKLKDNTVSGTFPDASVAFNYN